MHIHVCLYVCICVSDPVCVSLGVGVPTSLGMCVCKRVVCLFVPQILLVYFLRVSVPSSLDTCVHACLCVCMCMCVNLRVSLCVPRLWVCAHMSVSL